LFYSYEEVAIRGADPVAYFTDETAVKGSETYQYEWNGTTWRFATAENRDLFASNPEAYAPQYGGYCAWAVKEGYLASVDPEAWKIVDGKLYLNYSAGVQRQWERDIAGNVAKGDQNWDAVLASDTVSESGISW
jgi:YHS domain-containing protein